MVVVFTRIQCLRDLMRLIPLIRIYCVSAMNKLQRFEGHMVMLELVIFEKVIGKRVVAKVLFMFKINEKVMDSHKKLLTFIISLVKKNLTIFFKLFVY